ncbi:hypothetical protein Glove_130g114 [Diversispora epigaea]|uniref:Uncharacterized protein n=1 Tax=Diversispora epigaea TaxID=1348612 RepID=A0A397J4G0_9GLOM|nr:hypothetical protein Glove_130g114 [Diversispora epigaea]
MSNDELWTSTMDLIGRIQRVNIFPAPPLALQRAHETVHRHRRIQRGRRRPRHLAYFLYRNIVSYEINRISNNIIDHRVTKLVSDIIWNNATRFEKASYRRISEHMNEYH